MIGSSSVIRCGSACAFRTRRGLVWFGSVRTRKRFLSVPELSGSVRPVRFGSIFLPIVENQILHPHPHYRAPCMKYVEGSVRPISMYHPRKYVIPGI